MVAPGMPDDRSDLPISQPQPQPQPVLTRLDHTAPDLALLIRLGALENSLLAFKQLMDERDQRNERALAKAEIATDKRLEALNELRAMALDQNKNFARMDEVNLLLKALETRISAIDDTVKAAAARGLGMKEAWGYLLGLAGLTAAAFAYFTQHH